MNTVDYILDAVLVATVFVQLRGRRLTPRNVVLPVADHQRTRVNLAH